MEIFSPISAMPADGNGLAFSRLAVRSLFDEVFISAHKADLEIAELVGQNFAPYVKKLIYSSVYYPCDKDKRPGDWMYRSIHDRDDFPQWERLAEEHLEIRKTGEDFGHLLSACNSMVNLRKVVLTDYWYKHAIKGGLQD
ncbi:hypothetical protein MMC12_000238 [Toensbergia leucococca]|nr:hypothetical protein [Toensbergia leucococca]